MAIALVVLACSVPDAAATLYWGGTIKGETYGMSSDAPLDPSVLWRFEADAGKKVTMINTGQAWVTFDRPSMDATIYEGAIPLVTMGLPESLTMREVAEGGQDTQIRKWARAAREFGWPFLFRPWWEMNGTWFSWGRDPYFAAAWRRFHDLVEQEGATNVTWAWDPNSIWFDPGSNPAPYYPGDAYVDWVGMDAFNFGENPLQPDKWRDPEEVIGPTLDVLYQIAPDKPVCICEEASTEVGGDKATWIREVLGSYIPAHPAIRAYLWFNWNIEPSEGAGRWDWPIESSSAAQRAFHDGIQDSIYLSVLPPLEKLTKVPVPPLSPARAPGGPGASGPGLTAHGRFRVVRRRFDRRHGTAKLTVTLPGRGTLRVAGGGFRVDVIGAGRHRPPVYVSEPSRVVVRVAPARRTRRILRARGYAKVVLRLSFRPTGGRVQRLTVKLTLRSALPPHQAGLAT